MITILSVEVLQENYDIHTWAKYRPFDMHYETFKPHIIYAAHKINDVYYSFASARSYLIDFECENYGQLISKHDELHLNYIRSKCLQSALAHYNYAIDLSWQVIWFYLGDNSYLFMEKPEMYEKYSTLCTENRLHFKLDISKMGELKSHIVTFFNSGLTSSLREKYNYIKHRGSLHTEELGDSFSHYMGSYQNGEKLYHPTMITRRSFNLIEFKDTLMQFDISFYDYFNQIINWIMPTDFLETKFSLIIPKERFDFHFNHVDNHEVEFIKHTNEFYEKHSIIERVKQNSVKYVR